ncbi:MAG: c-type cytochrome [Beijerinckiaceae bacterium]
MKFIPTLAIAGLTLIGATAVMAQDPIAQRKEGMKAVGAATGPLGKMMRGEDPFDLAKVQAALTVYATAAKAQPALYPAGSDKGETRALPAVFSDKAKFDAIFVQWGNDVTAAQAAIKDEASFKTEMPKVLKNCGTCHETYRKPQ